MKTISLIKKRLTYFDVFLGLAFLAVFIGVYFFFNRKSEFVNIRVRVTDQDVLYAQTNPASWYANRFEVGDTEQNELGKPTSEILNVETFNMSSDTKVVYLDIKIKAVYDKRTKIYSAKGTGLIFGNTIKFNFRNASFYGLITESPTALIRSEPVIEKRRITLLQRSGWEPVVLQKIKKGDKITDSNNNVLVEVVDVKLSPALKITQNSQGDLLMKRDPYFLDATIQVDIKTKKYKGESFVFDTIPLKLGTEVPLNFSYTSIWPTIIDIK